MKSRAQLQAVVATVLMLAACGGASEPPQETALATTLVIEGEVVGGAGETILLERAGAYVGFTFEEVATTTAEAGRFRFETPLDAPELLYLSIGGQRGKAPVYAGNGVVSVRLSLDGETPAEITGSSIHTEFVRFEAAREEADEVVDAADDRLEEMRATADEQILAAAQQILEEAQAVRKSVDYEWLKRSGDSTLGAYIGIRYLALDMDVDELEPLMAALDPGLAGTPYYDQLYNRLRILQRVAVGQPAPDFSGPTRDGDSVALSSLRGNVVLVDFWASWCGPCREQNPELIVMYEELRGDGLEILGVGLEFQRDRWLDAMQADGLPWTNISDVTGFDMEAAQLFAIRSLPSNVVIDRDGTILAKNIHGDELRSAIESAL